VSYERGYLCHMDTFGFPFMVPGLMDKFQMISLKGTEVNEWKSNVGQTHGHG
jgi:hypothetical protein